MQPRQWLRARFHQPPRDVGDAVELRPHLSPIQRGCARLRKGFGDHQSSVLRWSCRRGKSMELAVRLEPLHGLVRCSQRGERSIDRLRTARCAEGGSDALARRILAFHGAVDKIIQPRADSSRIARARARLDAAACAAYLVDRLPEDQKARVSAVARRGAWTPLTQEEIDSQFVDDGLPEDTIVVVAQSSPIPRTPFAVRADMEPALKSQIRDALLAIQHDPELIARIGRWYEDPTEEVGLESLERFYDPVRETAQLLNLDLSAIQ